MSSGQFGLRKAAKRLVGCSAFVTLCNPVHPEVIEFQKLHVPVSTHLATLELALILCVHVYLFNRARYALKWSGVAIFFVIYAVFYSLVSGWWLPSMGFYVWSKYFFFGLFALLYFYGVTFSHVDSRIAGLVHNIDTR